MNARDFKDYSNSTPHMALMDLTEAWSTLAGLLGHDDEAAEALHDIVSIAQTWVRPLAT
jgi:hypothetical protein